MKYYLSSYKLGNKPQELKELFFAGKKVWLIVNAQDQLLDDQKGLQGHIKRNMDQPYCLMTRSKSFGSQRVFRERGPS